MFYENRFGIKKRVISLFICFVRIPARNSVNPIIQITIPHRASPSGMTILHGGESRDLNDRAHGISGRYSDKASKQLLYTQPKS